MFDGAEMLVHDGDGGVSFPPRNAADDLAMLVDGAIGRVRPSVKREDQRAARHDFAEIAPQQAIAGHLAQPDVKFAGEPNRDPRFARLAGGFLLADVAFEFGAEFRTPARDDEADDFALQRPPHLEDFLGLFQRRLCRGRRAPRRRIDQAFRIAMGESAARTSVRLMPKRSPSSSSGSWCPAARPAR